jgi:hypothetical protein
MNKNTLEHLTAIRDAYSGVAEVSAGINTESSDEMIQDVMDRRNCAFKAVTERESMLEKTMPDWKKNIKKGPYTEILEEIRSIVNEVLDRDVAIRRVVLERMEWIKDELSGLRYKAGATAAYAVNSRRF